VFTAIATLALIGVGGLVTSREAGMAVPDWPNTYGYNMFWFPFSKWVGGIFYEHTHRLTAAFVGFLTTILALWLWIRETKSKNRWVGVASISTVILLMGARKLGVFIGLAVLAPIAVGISVYHLSRRPNELRWYGIIAFASVILQGVLGGLRVVLFKDQIGIFHATLAQLFFVLICAIALFTSKWWQNQEPASSARVSGRLNLFLLGTTFLILAQLVLGATMRHQHAGLAIPDFPLAYGKVWPVMDVASVTQYNQQRVEVTAVNPITAAQIGLQMTHRIMALLIFSAVIYCALAARRTLGTKHPIARLGLLWLGLICAQAMLGAATIWSNKAADIATGHVLVGALSLMTGAMTSIVAYRLTVSASRPMETSPALQSVLSNRSLALGHSSGTL
jgi:cytochrome c oxidase assembly protein subunit 15